MYKIWILKHKKDKPFVTLSSRSSKFKIYREESKLLRDIGYGSDNLEILEFNLNSRTTTKDYLLSRERNLQLSSVLDNISSEQKNVIDLVNLYNEIAPNGKDFKKYVSYNNYIDTNTKNEKLKKLRKYQSEPKEIKKILIEDKKYFLLDVSKTFEWYKAVLKVHNFRQLPSSESIFDDYVDNFKLAKLVLKNKNKNK